MSKTSGKRRKYLIIVGLLLIAAALLLCLYNYFDDIRAGNEAQKALSALSAIIADNKAEIASNDGNSADGALEAIDNPNENEEAEVTEEEEDDSTVSLPEMPTVTIDGVDYIGVISLPKYDIELPVQAVWSEEGLKNGPARYAGTLADNNLIISGHNYKHHLGHLNTTKVGETIIFTDIYGNEYTYIVVKVETIAGDDAASMLAGENEWDLTLFSCTLSGSTRVTIRCQLVE